ncbi:predicted protein [Paecilomyces variotii No. 5]|uniref:Uncharacterized protein n=1 Tax=Byssochlamys spectabilis (strain No. 5 / NBRC 109023) TaxID=1356009 RepID=V5I2F7_BYSSN|nr:predicted protein [Paecilomyces variotii No. 5]
MNSTCQDGAADTETVEHIRFPFQSPSVNCGVSEDNPRRAASLLAFQRDLDSSESIPSEHSSLYDAARASSGSDTGDQTYYDSLSTQTTPDEQHGLSFTTSDQPIHNMTSSHSKWPVNTLATIIERKSNSTLRHSRSMSCLYDSFSGEGLLLSRPSRSDLHTSTFSNTQRRKALSFNDADSCPGTSELLGYGRYLASPGQPIYPPPTRSPTPPGLPSFGTQEALFCASRFAIQPPIPGPSGAGDGRRNSYDSSLSGSYSEAFRRLFGFSPPLEPCPPRLPLHAIARAEDGTAVRGRFPIRQSGHGMDISRPLDSHPFHRMTLPVAQPQVERPHPVGKRRSQGRDTRNSDVRTSSQGSESVLGPNLPSTLQRALTATMRRTDSTTAVGALPSLSSTQVPNSQSRGSKKNPRVHVTSCGQDTTETQDSNRPVSYEPTSPPLSSDTSPADGSPVADGTERHRILAYSELLRMYILAICCCSAEEDEEYDAVRLDPQQNPSEPTRDEIPTVPLDVASSMPGSAPSRHSATGECSNEQITRRSSRPWRPAYGFSPQTTDATMSTVG